MKEILEQLAEKAEEKISFIPATSTQIAEAEKRLNIQLPKEYKAFLELTNGFPSITYTEPTFLPVQDIDYLKNVEDYTIEAYSIEGLEDVGAQLGQSILVAGKDEEQYFLLIPPHKEHKNWKFWKFANWIPGEWEYDDLTSYFTEVIQIAEEEE